MRLLITLLIGGSGGAALGLGGYQIGGLSGAVVGLLAAIAWGGIVGVWMGRL